MLILWPLRLYHDNNRIFNRVIWCGYFGGLLIVQNLGRNPTKPIPSRYDWEISFALWSEGITCSKTDVPLRMKKVQDLKEPRHAARPVAGNLDLAKES